jgi:hypothetical protein
VATEATEAEDNGQRQLLQPLLCLLLARPCQILLLLLRPFQVLLCHLLSFRLRPLFHQLLVLLLLLYLPQQPLLLCPRPPLVAQCHLLPRKLHLSSDPGKLGCCLTWATPWTRRQVGLVSLVRSFLWYLRVLHDLLGILFSCCAVFPCAQNCVALEYAVFSRVT